MVSDGRRTVPSMKVAGVGKASKKIVIGVTTNHALAYHVDLARAMKKSGWEIHIVSTPGKQLELLSEEFSVEQIAMEREPSPVQDFRALIEWVKLFRKLRPNAIMVGTPKAGLLGIIAGWICRVPQRVYFLHGLRLESADGLLLQILKFLERVSIGLSTHTIAVSPSLRQKVVGLGLGSFRKVGVLDLGSTAGVDTHRFHPAASAHELAKLRSRFGLDDQLLTIGFVGRLTKDKGVKELEYALNTLKNEGVRFQLLLVGPVEDESGKKFVHAMNHSGVKTTSTGHVDDPESAYRVMDILCLPSYREGLPNVVLEAYASGVPVVGTNATGTTDVVADGKTGRLVEVRDGDALTAGLRDLLQSRSRIEAMGAEGLEFVQQHFGVKKVITRQQALFES